MGPERVSSVLGILGILEYQPMKGFELLGYPWEF